MRKEMVEKLERIVEKVSERFWGYGSYSVGTETIEISVWDGAFNSSCRFKKSLLEESEYMCVKIIFEALTDDNYVEIRTISETEYKIIDMITDNCICDGESYYINYNDGALNVMDSEDGEWYEIDLTDCELVKVIEATIEEEMELHIKYDDLLFIIKEVDGEAVTEIFETKYEEDNFTELERLRQENKELKEKLEEALEHDIREVTKRLQEQLKEYESRNGIGNFVKGVW